MSCDGVWCHFDWFKFTISLVRYFRFAGQVVAKALWDEQVDKPFFSPVMIFVFLFKSHSVFESTKLADGSCLMRISPSLCTNIF